MKIFFIKFLILLNIITFSFPQGKVVAAISSLKGNVLVKPIGTRKYIPAYKGQMLNSGDWLKTKTGVFIAIVFLDGSNIKIHQETEIRVTSYRMTAKELRTNLDLAKGAAWSNVADQGSAGEFTITTPTAVASVKGTEFDLNYDIEDASTTLTVISGEVEFANELGQILAGAMTSSKASADEKPDEAKKISEDQKPAWQKKTDPEIGFQLKPDKKGKQSINTVIKVNIEVVNPKTRKLNKNFTGEVVISSESDDLEVSSTGSSWSSSTNINITAGKGFGQVRSGKQGKHGFIIGSEGAESKKLEVEYYQSTAQKKQMNNKLADIASKTGNADLAKALEGKSLKSSKLKSGSGNVEDVLQKLDTGELQIDGLETIDNGDGTVTVKMVIRPRD